MSFAILNAVRNNDPKTLEFLLKNKTLDINASTKDGVAPIVWASYRKDSKCMELLIKAGADVNQQENEGLTPLMIASASYDINSIDILLNANADINIKNNNDNTAIDIATHAGLFTVVEMLNPEDQNHNYILGLLLLQNLLLSKRAFCLGVPV